jgi:hypothetical protein
MKGNRSDEAGPRYVQFRDFVSAALKEVKTFFLQIFVLCTVFKHMKHLSIKGPGIVTRKGMRRRENEIIMSQEYTNDAVHSYFT